MATHVVHKHSAEMFSMDSLKAKWGWVLTLGILLVLTGVIAVAAPLMATLAVGTFIGWIFIVSGAFQALQSFRLEGFWRISGYALLGIFYVVAGLGLLSSPLRGALTLTFFLGMIFLFGGATKTVMAIAERKVNSNWRFLLLSGLVTLALGFMLIAGLPSTATWAIGTIVGIELLFTGFSTIALATTMKQLQT